MRAHRTSTCACVQRAVASYYSAFPPEGLFSAPFADGCGLDESLAKVLRFVFLTVEDRFIERCPRHHRPCPQPFSLTATGHVILIAVRPRQPERSLSALSRVQAILGRCLQHRGGEPEQAKGADGIQLFALDCIAYLVDAATD